MKRKVRRPLFERLKAGLEEAIQFSRGELSLRTIVVPSPPPEITAREIVQLRQHLDMSQTVFAGVLNVSPKTVQSWEQGQRKPSHSALRILQLLREEPQVVWNVVGDSSTRATVKAEKPSSKRKAQPV